MRIKILGFYLIAIVLGVLTGVVGSCFQLAIHFLNRVLQYGLHMTALNGWRVDFVSAVASMVMVLIAWLLVRYVSPQASGSGVQEIEGALLHERPIHWQRLLPVKFIGGAFAIAAKMVLGREGPTIQMGGNLGEMLGEFFQFHRKQRDALIAAGSAAGLAVAFNAPLAGVLFVLEEMRNQFNFSFTHFKMVAICCVMATVVLHLIMGSQPAIPMAVFDLPSLGSLWLFFIFGGAVGVIGWLFNVLLMKNLYLVDQLNPKQHCIYVMLIGLLVGYFSSHYPAIVGGGYHIIEQSLTLSWPIAALIFVVILRFAASIICYSTGVPGGIFAPMLALGTLLGLAAAHFFQYISGDLSIHPGMFAVAGMGALFSAVVRAPITGIVLIVEMTQNYSLILPLMVACLTSTTVMQLAGNPPIYTQLLNRVQVKNKVSSDG